MIECPKCQTNKNLILERPAWDKFCVTDSVTVQAHCCECKLDFEVSAELSNIVLLQIIKTNVEYPFSA
jgi:hypothetical protein